MNILLITIGNELLSGFTVDTNAAWIGQELGKIGLQVSSHITLSDDSDSIIEALEKASDQDIVIVTGGLGPTHDDVTPSAFYSFFNDEPKFDDTYWMELTQRFQKISPTIPNSNRNQAMSPQKGKTITNPVGTARGLWYTVEGKYYFALPGVPKEMKAMMTDTIIPFLRDQSRSELIVHTIRTTGITESALAEQAAGILDKHPDVTVAFLPQLIGVDIRLTGETELSVNKIKTAFENNLGKLIFGYENVTLEEVVGKRLIEKGMTLSAAESCTGGLLSHRLTNIAGSSAFFKGGVVSYSNEAKMDILDVEEETLERVGAVSEQTAVEMAEGVRKLLKTDLGISITGIAGPDGGTDEKPVGLVYIGIANKNDVSAAKFIFPRDRKGNKYLSSQAALNMIRLMLSK